MDATDNAGVGGRALHDAIREEVPPDHIIESALHKGLSRVVLKVGGAQEEYDVVGVNEEGSRFKTTVRHLGKGEEQTVGVYWGAISEAEEMARLVREEAQAHACAHQQALRTALHWHNGDELIATHCGGGHLRLEERGETIEARLKLMEPEETSRLHLSTRTEEEAWKSLSFRRMTPLSIARAISSELREGPPSDEVDIPTSSVYMEATQ